MATILIADDSPTAVLQLKRMLEPLGHVIVVARDGREAARAFTEPSGRPDLALLDVVMPQPNGFELCRALKGNPATQHIPVFLVTSMTRDTDRYWGLKQGADEYLVKPVDEHQLREKVRARLGGP
jgi:twitching motility two-component system response regulator PilH